MNGILRSCESRGRLKTAVGAVLATWLVAVGSSVARAATETSPPDDSKPWLQWICMLAFVALCCAIAFKNPKRSHMT